MRQTALGACMCWMSATTRCLRFSAGSGERRLEPSTVTVDALQSSIAIDAQDQLYVTNGECYLAFRYERSRARPARLTEFRDSNHVRFGCARRAPVCGRCRVRIYLGIRYADPIMAWAKCKPIVARSRRWRSTTAGRSVCQAGVWTTRCTGSMPMLRAGRVRTFARLARWMPVKAMSGNACGSRPRLRRRRRWCWKSP